MTDTADEGAVDASSTSGNGSGGVGTTGAASTGTGGTTGGAFSTGGSSTTGGSTTTTGGAATTGSGDSGSTGGSTDGGATGTTGAGTTGTDTGTTGDTAGTDTGGAPVCDVATPVVTYLSPDDSNSMASYPQIRQALMAGTGIYAAPVRVWELFNYFTFPYAAPTTEPLGLHASLESLGEGEYDLQIAVTSPTVTRAERPRVNLTLVLDRSGSMAGDPIARLQDSVRAIAGALNAGDRVNLVEWSQNQTPMLIAHEVTGPNDATLLGKVSQLTPGGGTDLNGGLTFGYNLAQQTFVPGELNRVVLVSDGGANLGITDADLIGQNAAQNNGDGILMVGIGVGGAYDGYNDALMDAVTDAGKGASLFIGDEPEAWRMLEQRFESTMLIAQRDVRLEVNLPPGFEFVRYSAEEISTDPTKVEPQHIAPNDAMVFHQRVRTCAPELVTDATDFKVVAHFKDAETWLPKNTARTFTFGEAQAPDPLLAKGRAVLEFASALKTAQGYPPVSGPVTKAQAAVSLAAARAQLPNDMELSELEVLLAKIP